MTKNLQDVEDSFSQSHSRPPTSLSAKEKVDKVAELTKAENKIVRLLRFAAFGLLLAVTALVCSGVYILTSRGEEKDFEDGFEVHATQLANSFQAAVDQKLVAVGALANSMTSHALATQQEFPFVTIPDFSVRAWDTRVLADSITIQYCPIVTDENRLAWEEYAMENREQIDDAFEQGLYLRNQEDELYDIVMEVGQGQGQGQGQDAANKHSNRNLQEQEQAQAQGQQQEEQEADPNVQQDGTGYHIQIYDIVTNKPEPNGTGPFLPSWHRSPVNKKKQERLNTNWNNANVFRGMDLANMMIRDQKVVINKLVQLIPRTKPLMTANIQISQFRQKLNEYLEEPLSFLVYPVFDSFNTTSRQVAGVLLVNLYWRVYFQDVLPSDAMGIIAVIQNSYNQSNSYRIDGVHATLLGDGDYHDPAFDDKVVSVDVTRTAEEKASPENRAYLTAPLHDTIGLYTIKVYPTNDTKAAYTSKKPVIYTVVVALIFLITGGTFLLFDNYVERRQKIVKNRAMEAGAIVDSLFPEEVQERMFKGTHEREQAATKKEQTWNSDAKKSHGLDQVVGAEDSALCQTNQIADLYDSATVIFSDLAGFTEWSSSRNPSQVFELLESIYNAMDAIALRRKVFKVETIGDCWLGVCGLPNPNPRHAIVTAKFAFDCQRKVQEILLSKVESLGEGTELLNLRTGLHSGPVTAGVLRGQKSRFQLFGDTVNTASRMESLGQPGRIHASQSTADQIIASGKKDWLTAREDKVFAKGKGKLQTFWVRPNHDDLRSVYTSDDTIATGSNSGHDIREESAPTAALRDEEGKVVSKALADDWV